MKQVSVCKSSAACAETISSATGTGMLLSLTFAEPGAEVVEMVRWSGCGDC